MNPDELREDELLHYGIIRKSGRYPWGSGEDAYQRSTDFLAYIDDLKRQGLTESQIAKGVGMSTTEIRAANAIAKNQKRKADESQALRLKDKGMSNVAIGARMGIPESSVRALLDPSRKARADVLTQTADMLKKQLETKSYLDIGVGTERYVDVGDGSAESVGIAKTKLDTAVAMLKDEGYGIYHVKVEQVGMPGKYTDVKVLVPPGTTYSELYQNRDKIRPIKSYTEDDGHTFEPIVPPKSISAKRVAVRYGPDGGAQMDGVIELRPGVIDTAIPNGKRYAQVRIAVDDSHYLKGMAMYAHDLPPGVDMRFNTNKKDTGNKLDALKSIKDDAESPFGAVVRQHWYMGADGQKHQSVLNMVGDPKKEESGEEGGWLGWSKNLSSQMLSKQQPELAKRQLDMAYNTKKEAFDEIKSLTNPAVKKILLDSFSDDADSAAVHLKAAPLPGQGTHVILPIKSMKDNEIYAPNYKQGESVVLIRHPHGGRFEIPELRVNNRQPEAKSLLGNIRDAVGINANVAARLSGADFDGDTVIVIPNKNNDVKTSAPLAGLKNFSPSDYYGPYDGMKTIDGGIYHESTDKVEYGPKGPSGKTKQREMGDVSNLITDMTIKGANKEEIVRAVKHSMVVIDSEKHKLNYRQSFQDNGIASLKAKYQGAKNAGASTLISKAKSEQRVPERKLRRASEGGPIDPVTGEKRYTPTGANYVQTKVNKRTGETIEKTIFRKDKSTKMAETNDAHTLSSGRPIEEVYANHANKLKALANMARLESLHTPPSEYSPSAAKAYAKEVSSLNAKLNIALKNKPLERQAQLLGNANVAAKKKADPNMDASDLKKIKNQELTRARARVGAAKQRVDITPPEWEAIQAGAVSNHKLVEILKNTDVDVVRQYATPRTHNGLSPAIQTRAKAMLARGYTQAEVAEQLGVSTNTLNKELQD